jgi:hypothetical protein
MTVGGRINPSDVDEFLSALDAAHERISTALFRLDAHPRLDFLRGDGLAGATARIAREMPLALPGLWERFGVLGRYLDRVREIRADRTWLRNRERVALLRLLHGREVPVNPRGAPPPDVSIPATPPERSAAPPARRLTLMEFARELEQACTRHIHRLDRLDGAIAEVVGELLALEGRLNRVQAQAVVLGVAEAGDPVVAELTAAQTELDRLRHRSLADPLAADRPTRLGTRPFTDALDAAQARLAQLARIRDGHPERLAKLRTKVDEVAAAESEAAAACRVVYEKIARPDLPPAPPGADQLRRRMSKLEELARDGWWPRFVGAAAGLEDACVVAYRQARRLRSEANRLLDQRAELRGRLGGLAAMAGDAGGTGHPELAAALAESQRLLDAEPCDLAAAAGAADRLQRLVTGLAGRPEESQ